MAKPEFTATRPTRGYSATKEQLLKRLARVEGQVRGVSGMVENERYCIDVLTQISAIQAALDKISSACSTTTPATACRARPARPATLRNRWMS